MSFTRYWIQIQHDVSLLLRYSSQNGAERLQYVVLVTRDTRYRSLVTYQSVGYSATNCDKLRIPQSELSLLITPDSFVPQYLPIIIFNLRIIMVIRISFLFCTRMSAHASAQFLLHFLHHFSVMTASLPFFSYSPSNLKILDAFHVVTMAFFTTISSLSFLESFFF